MLKIPTVVVRIVTVFAFIVLAFGAAHATRHVITFGGSLGDGYAPESLKVSVGDTIVWSGNFSEHPLTLTKAPKGAAAITHIHSGKSYQYVVTVAGSYEYQCDKHVDEGMTGAFTAFPPAASGK